MRRPSPAQLLALALLLAALLRLWQLAALPPGLYHDEAYNGLDALSLLAGKQFPQFYEGWEQYARDAQAERLLPQTRFPLFFAGNYGREPLHIYLMALSLRIFGATPFAIRLVPALAGVLGVLTTYLAGRALLPEEKRNYVPAFAALFTAILFPAVHFSRFGLRTMLFVPVSTLAVACFWWGVNRPAADGRRRALLLGAAGFFLGLGIYVYAAGRLLPLLWLLFIPSWFLLDRNALRRFWRPVGLMAGVALLTALPLLVFFARYPYFFSFRLAYVANRGRGTVPGRPWLTWLLNVGRVVGGLFWRGETHLRHNLPGRPYLDLIQAPLFLIGLGDLVRRRGNSRALFLSLWLVVMLLPTILSGDAPHFGRMTGALPAIALLLGLGAARGGQLLRGRGMTAGAVTALGAILLAGSTLWTVWDYFGRYASHPQLAADFYLPDWELGEFLAAQPAETTLYLAPTQEELATLYFALADPEQLRDFNGEAGALPAGHPERPSLYVLRSGQEETLLRLQTYFPAGAFVPTAHQELIAYAVPAGSPLLPAGTAVGVTWDDEIGLLSFAAAESGAQLQITLIWQAAAAPARDYTAYVHLLAADGTLVAQVDRQPAGYPTGAWRPDEIVVDTLVLTVPPDAPLPLTLQTGFYDLPTLTRLGAPHVLNPAYYPGEDP